MYTQQQGQVPNNSQAVSAPLPSHVLNRGQQRTVSVMESIHSMKVYNAAPGKAADPTKAGKIMIKNSSTEGRYQVFADQVRVNILSIRKGLNGSYILLNEHSQPILDQNNEPKRGFAFSEEYYRFAKNTQEILFKDKDRNGIVKQTIGEIKAFMKTPNLPNGSKNPYHTTAKDRNHLDYDSSFISESFVVYGQFLEGEYAGEIFRLFMSGGSSFGSKFNSETKSFDVVSDSLNHALMQGQQAFNSMYQGQGSFDDSLLVTTLKPNQEGNFFMPRFYDNALIDFDNTQKLNELNEIREAYFEQEFGGVNNNQQDNNTLSQPVQNVPQPETYGQPVENKGYYTPTPEQNAQQGAVVNPVTGQQAPAQSQPVMPAQGQTQNKIDNQQGDISIADVPF